MTLGTPSARASHQTPTSGYCTFANYLMANGVMPKSPDVVDSTNGCATGNFCGTATVTRADMAVYMARAIAGSDAQVPAKYSNAEAGRSYDIATPSTLVFTDVAANAQMGSVQYAKHVYYLWALNIVSGTSSTTYSPANSVTRGQMATFLAAGFHLPRRPATGAAFADRIAYATNGTIASVLHGDGTRDVTDIDPNSIARPFAIKTYGAPVNYSSGNYAYDGAGNIKTIGPDHFYYDLASRLTEGTTSAGTKAQQLAYDAYGNITSRTNNGTNTGYTIQASTNRATAVGGTSWGYDGAGDVTSIGTTTYAYDSLGMMTKLTTSFTSYYFYTPDDERIWSKTGSGSSWASTWTVRGTDAKVLREMTSTATSNTGTDANYAWKRDYVYRDGLLLAAITATDTLHFHLDHLGTPRLITYLNGTASAERHDYYPFGEEVTLAGNEEMKFTGHERDSNSGLDYMHARYTNEIVGRFLGADKGTAYRHGPASWNRYAYVQDNPVKFVDPDGQDLDFFARDSSHKIDLNFGHASLRVYGKGYDLTFDFGRYGGLVNDHQVSGVLHDKAHGYLRVWNNWGAFVTYERSKGPVAWITYQTPERLDMAIINYFRELIASGNQVLLTNNFIMYRLQEDYDLRMHNCATICLDAIDAGLSETGLKLNDYESLRTNDPAELYDLLTLMYGPEFMNVFHMWQDMEAAKK